jgi:hypothetical protein
MSHSQGTVGTGICNYQPATTVYRQMRPRVSAHKSRLIIPNQSPLSPFAETHARLTCAFVQGLRIRDRRGISP